MNPLARYFGRLSAFAFATVAPAIAHVTRTDYVRAGQLLPQNAQRLATRRLRDRAPANHGYVFAGQQIRALTMCVSVSRVAALLTSLFMPIESSAAIATPVQTPEGTSLLGKPLVSVPPAGEQKARLEADLAKAQADYDRDPASADATIWLGRRLAYLGRFRDAIDVYSKGIERHPNEPRLYRHRGHRYITIRKLDLAIEDLRKASQLIAGKPDEIEPDGAPNRAGIPRSTLQSNIWYHLGLAQYLRGDFTAALESYREGMKVSRVNDDMLVATTDWLYMTLRRLGRDAEARQVLEPIREQMDILENTAYHQRLLMYKGLRSPDSVLNLNTADDVQIATQGYGVGNWYLVSGDRAKAREIFSKVVAGKAWQAFGFIAAEADLKRGID